MSETVDEFTALLKRAQQGDDRAVAEIIQQYEDVLRRAARGLLGPLLRPHLDSLDLVQSVHRSLWIGLRHGKFDISSPEKLIALAMTMVRRKAARKWRKTRRKPVSVSPSDTGETCRGLDSLAGDSAGPVSIVQFDDQVRHVIKDLDPIDQELVELRLQGYGTADVARKLGVDSAHLRVRLARLRKRLRDDGLFDEWL